MLFKCFVIFILDGGLKHCEKSRKCLEDLFKGAKVKVICQGQISRSNFSKNGC